MLVQVDALKQRSSLQHSLIDMDHPAMPSIARHSDPYPKSMNQVGLPPRVAAYEVDGVSSAQVDRWFQEAGPGADGILEPNKAAQFFARSGLARGQLSQVRDLFMLLLVACSQANLSPFSKASNLEHLDSG